jgi:hypothetical protein
MDDAHDEPYRFFDPGTARSFRALAACVVPADGDAPGADDPRCLRLADAALAERPEQDRKLLSTFLRALEWLPMLRHGRRFSSLGVARATAFLNALERNRLVPALRAGVFGVKAYALLGFYGHELSFDEIRYPGPRRDAPYYQLRVSAPGRGGGAGSGAGADGAHGDHGTQGRNDGSGA